jgi:hypothetical protein
MDLQRDYIKSGPYSLGLIDPLGPPGALGFPAGPYYDFGLFPPAAKAEYPLIGPYSTLDDYTPFVRTPILDRKTVLPDGRVTVADCPMPPAKVRFRILFAGRELGFLKNLAKWDVYSRTETIGFDPVSGEPVTAIRHTKPFYYEMIPASPLIPPFVNNGGYDWNSYGWPGPGGAGPYPFWAIMHADRFVDNEDPGVVFFVDPIYGTSQRSVSVPGSPDGLIPSGPKPSEAAVYSDNSGEARILVNGFANLDALPYLNDIGGYDLTDAGRLGRSVVRAYVDYPYFRNFPTFRSNSRTMFWTSGFSVRTDLVELGAGQWKLFICKKNISGLPVEGERVNWTITDGEGRVVLADPTGVVWGPRAASSSLGQDGCSWIVIERHGDGPTHVNALLPDESIKRSIMVP